MYIVIYTEYDQICISKWSFGISKLSSWTRRRCCVCGRGLEQKEESANLFCDLSFETAEWTCSNTTKMGNHLLHPFIGFPSLAVSDVQSERPWFRQLIPHRGTRFLTSLPASWVWSHWKNGVSKRLDQHVESRMSRRQCPLDVQFEGRWF